MTVGGREGGEGGGREREGEVEDSEGEMVSERVKGEWQKSDGA